MGAAGSAAHLRLPDVRGRRAHRGDRAPGWARPHGDNGTRLPARVASSHHHGRRGDGPDLEFARLTEAPAAPQTPVVERSPAEFLDANDSRSHRTQGCPAPLLSYALMDQGGNAARRRAALPAAGLWPWEGPARRGRAFGATGCTDQVGIRTSRAGSTAGFLAHDCPSRGHQVKGALRASLPDRHSPTLDPATAHKGSAAMRKTGADQDRARRVRA